MSYTRNSELYYNTNLTSVNRFFKKTFRKDSRPIGRLSLRTEEG